jgi:hypothetical protein
MNAANAASITVAKRWIDAAGNVVVAGMPSSVGFTATGAGVSSGFTLGANGVFSTTFANLAAGSFAFAETPMAGWTLASAACVDAANSAPVAFSLNASNMHALALAAGQNVTCTFTNQATTGFPVIVTTQTPVAPTTQTIPSIVSPTATVTTVTSPSVLTPTAETPGATTTPSTAVAGVQAPSTQQGPSAVAGVQAPSTGSGSSSDGGTNVAIVAGLAAIVAGAAGFGFLRRRRG